MQGEGWKAAAERLKFDEGKSWTEVYAALAPHFGGLSEKQIEERVRGYLRRVPRYKSAYPKLVFSDPHAPFDMPNFPYFLRDTAAKYGTKSAICLGDLIDMHAISRHGAEPCALGAYSELDLARQRLKLYTTLIPECDRIKGNHDIRVERQAASVGIGSMFLRDIDDVLDLPDGWKQIPDESIIDGVLYAHGLNWTGKNGALNKAINEGVSVCIGHSHAFGGVSYQTNKTKTIFGMYAGCGVNREAYAFAYGKYAKHRETLGCGIVFGPTSAEFVPMGKEYLEC